MYKLTSENIHTIQDLAKNKDFESLKKVQKGILKVCNGNDIVWFAANMQEFGVVDLKASQDRLAQLKDYSNLFFFARDVEGADKKAIEDVIAQSNDMQSVCMFAKGIKGANIERLQSIVAKSGQTKQILEFATIKKSDKELLSKAMAEYTTIYTVSDALTFAKEIPGADIEVLEEAVTKVDNAKTIYEFARDVKGANIKKLEEAIVKTRYAPYIRIFAGRIKGADKARLEKIASKLDQKANAPRMQLVEYDKIDLSQRTEELFDDLSNFEK